MAQNFEYPMYSPHPRAKLYKRYTGDQAAKLKGGAASPITMGSGEERVVLIEDKDTIVIQNNRYVLSGTFKWTETTNKETNDEQPIDGLTVENDYLTIRTNSLKEFAVGDIIELPKSSPFGGLWIVQSGKTVDYAYCPKQVQTYQYLPLSSLG